MFAGEGEEDGVDVGEEVGGEGEGEEGVCLVGGEEGLQKGLEGCFAAGGVVSNVNGWIG